MIIPRPLKRVLGKIIPFSQEDKIPTFNLGSGTADYTTYLRGDGTWAAVGGGSVPDSRTITIDGVSQDLSADRTWNVIPSGGTTGQILAKLDNTSYNLEWIENFANYTSTLKHEVKAGEAMTKGQAVYVSSADGTNMIVSKASNATEATSSKTMGLIAQNLAHNGKGFVITEGLLAGLNTASATDGDPVWLGTNGNLIYGLINKPAAPAHLVFIGIVTRANSNNGEIFVRVQNGFELQELHNVAITTPANGQVLQYESATSLWKNATPSSGALTVGTTAIASGTIGRILFQNGGDVLGQDSNLFWDNTNKRLGIGATPASTVRLDVRAQGALSTDIVQRWRNSADTANLGIVTGDGAFTIGTYTNPSTQLSINSSLNFGLYVAGITGIYAQNQQGSGSRYGIQSLGRSNVVGATAYGIRTGADSSSASTINYGIQAYAYNGTTNYAGYFDATGGTNNYALYIQRGDILLGNATTNKIGFWNATPIVQPTTAITAATFVSNTSLIANDTATFDGYTIGKVVKALRNIGILA